MIIIPFSMNILINLSIVTVITNVLNYGLNMAFNIGKSLESRIEEIDHQSGALIKPAKHIRELKSFNYVFWMKLNLISFAVVFIIYICFGTVTSLFPEINSGYKVKVSKTVGIEIFNEINDIKLTPNSSPSSSPSVTKRVIPQQSPTPQQSSTQISSVSQSQGATPNVSNNYNIIATTDHKSNKHNGLKSAVMLIVAILSWIDIVLILVSYLVIFKISWNYVKLLKPKQ